MQQFGVYVDVLAISCGSFNPETLKEIGRYQARKDHIGQLRKIRDWCELCDIRFKINTVVCQPNKDESLWDDILELKPVRWKVFHCSMLAD